MPEVLVQANLSRQKMFPRVVTSIRVSIDSERIFGGIPHGQRGQEETLCHLYLSLKATPQTYV